ncbi:hypothetical protein [Phaeodactylibacter xiamenensis]|uniref:hypothetical protein n=1 Tax=Phaeodactylibacter xiamenensis TaxID=1524460 RepID=UPI003CCB99A9
MKSQLTSLLVLVTVYAFSQNFGTAVLMDTAPNKGEFNKIFVQAIVEKYNNQSPPHTEFYTWNENPESNPEPIEALNGEGFGTIPIKQALYLDTQFSFEKTLKTNYQVDTLGNVLRMFVYYPHKIGPRLKMIDLPTSEVIAVYAFDTKDWGIQEHYQVTDFKKYFGDNPKLLERNRKVFNEKMKAFKKAELKRIDEFYTKKVQSYGKNIDLARLVKASGDKRLFKVDEFTLDEKDKWGELYLDAKSTENIAKGDVLSMYQLSKYGDFEMYTPVSGFSIVEVTQAGPDRTKAVPSVFAKKKMTEALQSGDEIVFARSTALINEANRRDEPMKRVQVKGECFMCELYLESILLDVATTKLIERNFDQQRSYFTDQYTAEKFMDFKMEAVQDKQEGVEVIFEKTSTGMKATDVQTGRIVGLEHEEASGVGGLLKLPPNRKVQIVNMCMDIMNKDLEILEITKEKKGKIKEFLGYSAFGFENISTLYIMKITEETVGGRTVEREEEIGQVWAKRKKTNTIAEVKVTKGEKELQQALDNGDKIRFKVRY